MRTNRKQNGSTAVWNIWFFFKFYYLHIVMRWIISFHKLRKKSGSASDYFVFFYIKLIDKLVEAFKVFFAKERTCFLHKTGILARDSQENFNKN